MDRTVLYHANCPDGYAAAFACWQVYRENAQYLPVQYGQPCPEIPLDHTVMIVDFSYPQDILLGLVAQRIALGKACEPYVTVLDHHASAEKMLAGVATMEIRGLRVYFDLNESGASLTWKYLKTGGWHPKDAPEVEGLEHSMPTFYKYVRDRDLWRWALPDSKAVSLAYWGIEKDWLSIEQFAQDLDEAEGYSRIVAEGGAMQRYAERLVAEQAARAFEGIIGEHRVPIVNTTTLFSEVGAALCTTRPEIPFCAYYFDRSATQRQWGLRGHGKVDCSVIAALYGGGGHPDAAGFVTEIGWLPPQP